MTSKSLRRLAADHANLHTKGLPPNYLWPPSSSDADTDLTTLTLLLAGPEGTPFAPGLYTLTLSIPPTYPTNPPTARFSTRIFHPNVDPSSGAVCVETLKRDWRPELTLRDILVTVGCLLIFPGPDSALNAEAGRLVTEDWEGYVRKAGLWARMHAAVPVGMRGEVEEARRRGEDAGEGRAGPSQSAVEKKRRREREQVRASAEDVFVREDSIQRSPTGQFAAPLPPPAQASKAMGLGLGIDLPEGSSIHINAPPERPTQPPAPARRRKKPTAAEDEQNNPQQPATSSFANSLPTPTPGLARPFIHSNPSTPRLGRPEPKRRRLTPEDERRTDRPARIDAGRDDEPWLNWERRSPFDSPEDARSAKRRRVVEEKRWNIVQGDLERWNAGDFGPRIGLERL